MALSKVLFKTIISYCTYSLQIVHRYMNELPPFHLSYHNIDALRINTLRPRQNGRHFPADIFKCILLNENVWIPKKNSLKFVPKGPINNIPSLVQIMAWRRSGDKPLSEPMMVNFFTYICVTRPQWVKYMFAYGPNCQSGSIRYERWTSGRNWPRLRGLQTRGQ